MPDVASPARALMFHTTRDLLLVAGEGGNLLTELDANVLTELDETIQTEGSFLRVGGVASVRDLTIVTARSSNA